MDLELVTLGEDPLKAMAKNILEEWICLLNSTMSDSNIIPSWDPLTGRK